MAVNYFTGIDYSGNNNELLNIYAFEYPTAEYVTYLQAKELGGNVKKGEKGVQIIKVLEDDGDTIGLRKYTVFNIAQCENIDSDLRLTAEQYEVYKALAKDKALKKDGGNFTRKQLAKTSALI